MASAMRKVAEYLGLYEGGSYPDGVADANGYDAYSESVASPVAAQPVAPQPVQHVQPVSENANVMEQSLRPVGVGNGELTQIRMIHPQTYNEARQIGLEFRQGVSIILNLNSMDDREAMRFVDFASGLTFGLHGTISKIDRMVFLLSPANVDLGAAARAQLAQDPFFNQS